MKLTIDAVVPLRWPGEPKRRLATLLTLEQRRTLSLAMVRDVCRTLDEAPGIREVVVVSPGALPAEIALPGTRTLIDAADSYSAAANAGAHAVVDRGADAFMVLPSDLPLLRHRDVGQLITALNLNDVTLAPDRFGCGTNVLGCRRHSALAFQFGHQSFRKHMLTAVGSGWRVGVVRSQALGHDIDRPIDLIDLCNSRRLDSNSATAKLLARWQLESLPAIRQPVGL